MNKELAQKIRDARFVKGRLISELIDTFGAQAVYEAFGIIHSNPLDIFQLNHLKRHELPPLDD